MTEQLPLNTAPQRVKLKVEDYLLLDASGAFDDYAKTELIDGEVVFMNAQHRPHARIKSRLFRLLADALDQVGEGLEAIVEGSVAMPPIDAPEPDIVVTDKAEGAGLIPVDSVRLLVEVADSTLDTDLGRKAATYARHGIREYWVVDCTGRVIHQLSTPREGAYGERRQVPFGTLLEAATLKGLSIDTSRIG